MEYSWQFNKMRPADKAREPILGEFFATDAIENPGEALVREGIQNSLDARFDNEKVIVRIRISGTEAALQRAAVNPFLNGLDEHLNAPGNGLQELPDPREDCPILVFEDFGTTGLIGDPNEWKPVLGSRNNFYHFFRAEGRSDKTGKDIGRWGVGKQVFPRVSRINSVFGLTVRESDGKKLLMGMSILKSHDVNGVRFKPDGLLGISPENSEDDLILPIEDSAFIEHFIQVFDIERGDDPGLTIVVPWCHLELTDENLVRAVLRGYFWPILRGELEVIVEARKIETILDANSLEQEIRKIGNNLEQEIMPLIKLANWAHSPAEPNRFELTKPDQNRALHWSRELFPETSLSKMRELYELGDKIAIRVPVNIRQKDQPPQDSFFDIFMFRDGSERSGRPTFIREGIIIPDVRSPRTRGVRAIVMAKDDPIATFLGDSENPAHTQWQKDGANFRNKYVSGPTDLQFVIRSVHEIVNLLCEHDTKEDRTLLADVFSIPAPPEEPDVKTPEEHKSEDDGDEPEEVEPPEPAPKIFSINRIDRGFVVSKGNAESTSLPILLQIKAAYHVRRGNPFKKYRPADFNFMEQMEVSLKGAIALEKDANRLVVRIDQTEFRIKVAGFDSKRDLRVEVRKMEEDIATSHT